MITTHHPEVILLTTGSPLKTETLTTLGKLSLGVRLGEIQNCRKDGSSIPFEGDGQEKLIKIRPLQTQVAGHANSIFQLDNEDDDDDGGGQVETKAGGQAAVLKTCSSPTEPRFYTAIQGSALEPFVPRLI
ncbi:MAG: hypothetical protein SGCHY_003182, partial [Lobulomycetales sp.]